MKNFQFKVQVTNYDQSQPLLGQYLYEYLKMGHGESNRVILGYEDQDNKIVVTIDHTDLGPMEALEYCSILYNNIIDISAAFIKAYMMGFKDASNQFDWKKKRVNLLFEVIHIDPSIVDSGKDLLKSNLYNIYEG